MESMDEDRGQALPVFSSSLRPIFSDGSVVFTDLSRIGPSKGHIFKPDTMTQQLIDQFLVVVTQSAMGMDNADIVRDYLQSIDLSRLTFGDELKEFFCADGTESLSGAELRIGFQRMGENFMGRSHEIQGRANSFILQVIGSAEMQVMNCCTSDLAELYEKAQLLLLLAPSVTPARDSSAEPSQHGFHSSAMASDSKSSSSSSSKKGTASSNPKSNKAEPDYFMDGDHKDSKSEAKLTGPFSRPVSAAIPGRPVLFRSKSTVAADMKSSSSSCFTMDTDATNAVTKCLPTIFHDKQEAYADELIPVDYHRYHELWDYFDLDNDGTISRQDLQFGVSMFAENFIAVDAVSQQIANSYLQRKINTAMHTVDRLQERARGSSAAAGSPGAGRQGLGQCGQGQGLGVGTRSANNAEEEGPGPGTHTPRGTLLSGLNGQHLTGNTPRQHSANSSSGSGNNNSNNNNSNSVKMSGPGSGGGLQGNGGTEGGQGANGSASGAPSTPIVSTAGALSPGSIAMWVDAEKVSRRVVIKSYQGDGYYRVHIGVGAATIDTHESKLTAVADLPVSSLYSPTGSRAESSSTSSEHDESRSPGGQHSSSLAGMFGLNLRSPFTPRSSATSRSPRATAHLGENANNASSFDGDNNVNNRLAGQLNGMALGGDTAVGSGLGLGSALGAHNHHDGSGNGGQPYHNGAGANNGAVSSSSGPELALITSLKNSLGPGFKLNQILLPDPKFKQDYHLKFGVSRQFWFEQVDYGVKFEPFLGLDYVSDPETVTSCSSALENFRCMFLHLGVGIMVHPFVLQVKFRVAAERLLSLPDEELVKALFSEQLVSVMLSDSYVEMDVMHAIWPSELNGYRVMLVSFEEVGTKGFYGFKSIVTYTPETGPFDANKRWTGKDVIMTLKDGHFTLLNPAYGDERNSKPWSDYPVDDLMAAIEEYNTEYTMQSVCLQPYQIGPYLHPEGVTHL